MHSGTGMTYCAGWIVGVHFARTDNCSFNLCDNSGVLVLPCELEQTWKKMFPVPVRLLAQAQTACIYREDAKHMMQPPPGPSLWLSFVFIHSSILTYRFSVHSDELLLSAAHHPTLCLWSAISMRLLDMKQHGLHCRLYVAWVKHDSHSRTLHTDRLLHNLAHVSEKALVKGARAICPIH
jgi:hypothetical protein